MGSPRAGCSRCPGWRPLLPRTGPERARGGEGRGGDGTNAVICFFPFFIFFFFQVLKILSGNSFQECDVLSYAFRLKGLFVSSERKMVIIYKKKKAKQTNPEAKRLSAAHRLSRWETLRGVGCPTGVPLGMQWSAGGPGDTRSSRGGVGTQGVLLYAPLCERCSEAVLCAEHQPRNKLCKG